jgi:hypothetical protein
VAVTLGGPISGAVGSIFVAASDEAIPGLDCLQRHSFMKHQADLAYINDSGDFGRSDVAVLKQAFAPVETQSLYRVDLSL